MAKMSKTQRTAILTAHAERGSVRGRRVTLRILAANGWGRVDEINRGTYPTLAGLLDAGVDIDALHAEALADHALWGTGHAGYRAAMNALHAQALVEDFLRRPYMVRAMEIRTAQQRRAAGCFHPRSCRSCDTAGKACGGHVPGEVGHERCGSAPRGVVTVPDLTARLGFPPHDQADTAAWAGVRHDHRWTEDEAADLIHIWRNPGTRHVGDRTAR
jgi:hypothetical protein